MPRFNDVHYARVTAKSENGVREAALILRRSAPRYDMLFEASPQRVRLYACASEAGAAAAAR